MKQLKRWLISLKKKLTLTKNNFYYSIEQELTINI
jgi:hypothetical protein